MAHGAVLRSQFFTTDEVEAIARDYRNAGLAPVDVAVMDFARKVTLHAYKITEDDIAQLKDHGLSDAEVLDVALTAASRSFFSKTLDAVGAEADEAYLKLEDSLRDVLTVGRSSGESTQGG